MAKIKDFLNSTKEKRNSELEELKARLEALEAKNNESQDEAELKATGEEIDALKAKKAELEAELADIDAQLADLDQPKEGESTEGRKNMNHMQKEERKNMNIQEKEARAKKFVETRRMAIENEEVRSVLVSGGTLVTPTGTDGINDNGFAKVSSILDLIKVVNCVGMGANKVAYEDTDATADKQAEGGSAKSSDPTFGFVEIRPESIAVLSSISKQAKKQSPLQYEAKVKESAMVALRKKASAIVIEKTLASELLGTLTLSALDQHAVRKIALNYGGEEGIEGEAYLVLNKADLITLGDVRGTQDKKAVFEIIPDANPNTGVIKDGGLTVRYVLDKNLTAGTLLYGQLKNIELDLFSNYEIAVSEDFYFDKLMDAIRGDVELGSDVVAKYGITKITVGP